MPWYESPYFFAFWLMFFIVGTYLDARSSEHFEWYGLHEGNKLMKTADGLFDYGKNMLWSAAYCGVAFLIAILTGNWGAGAAILVLGGPARLVTSLKNNKDKKRKRAEQFRVLTMFRNDPGSSYSWPVLVTTNGKSYFPLFQFLSIPANPADPQGTIDAADYAVRQYAQNIAPENWFKY